MFDTFFFPDVSFFDTLSQLTEERRLTIRSFKDKAAEAILADEPLPRSFPSQIARVARRKLVHLDAANELRDLAFPPGNRLETLRGDLAGRHSIRINDQYRIVFRWTDAGAEYVEIADYH